MPHVYRVWYHNPEGSMSREFTHAAEMTDAELRAHVLDAMAEVARRERAEWEQMRSEMAAKGEDVSIYGEHWHEHASFGDLMYPEAFVEAMAARGFELFEYEASFSMDSWANAFGRPEREREDAGEKTRGLQAEMRKRLEIE